MQRIYTSLIIKHLAEYSQMAFVSGPRQVGKTTITQDYAKSVSDSEYLNWDNPAHKKQILNLFELEAAKHHPLIGTHLSQDSRKLFIFDEIHKFKNWKNYVKGFYDTYKNETQIIVTGSSRLNVYRKSGDSLMGRYFNYTVHPLSIGEIIRPIPSKLDIQPPMKCSQEQYDALFKFGGYPEPFLKRTEEFHRIWQNLRFSQLFREDIRDIEDVKSIGQLELLAQLLQEQSASITNYSTLASKVQVADVTVKKWIQLLESFYYCFTLKPWHTNVGRSLTKKPKIFLWDWSVITDPGARFETFIAAHLLKSVNFWNETGLGNYDLFYMRTKEKKEVDFVVTKNNKPWILVEAKFSDNNSLSKQLFYFQEKTGAPFAFQVVHNLTSILHKGCKFFS